jgi:urea carboxylase-associated protein 1
MPTRPPVAILPHAIIHDEIVPARRPWSRVIARGDVLRLVDLEGQQAVDFLCYDADHPLDRYSSMNTIKVQGNVYVGGGSVLYADSGKPLLTVIADTIGRHDTVYGCCSRPNNLLRYGKPGEDTCYDNFTEALAAHGLDRSAIVGNINFFMSVPIEADGSAGVAADASPPGSTVDLRAECNVLAALSNCPQMLNPCNGYDPSPIRAIVYRP